MKDNISLLRKSLTEVGVGALSFLVNIKALPHSAGSSPEGAGGIKQAHVHLCCSNHPRSKQTWSSDTRPKLPNFPIWVRAVLFGNSRLSYAQFPCLLSAMPASAPCCTYTKCPDAPPVFPQPPRKKAMVWGSSQSSVTPFAGRHGAKRHEEERAEIKVVLGPASSYPFWSRVCTDKSKIAALQSSSPCSPGKGRRLTVMGKQFFCLSSRTTVSAASGGIGIYFSLLSAEPWLQ